MDLKKVLNILKKYKYAIIILILGIFLMNFPSSTKERTPREEVKNTSYSNDLEAHLSELLSSVTGAGKVKVILSVDRGEETVYQTDENTSGGAESGSYKTDTVTIDKTGLVKQINPPLYKGAIVLCQGADSPQVRLDIVDAVSKITGLGADRISVLKMN